MAEVLLRVSPSKKSLTWLCAHHVVCNSSKPLQLVGASRGGPLHRQGATLAHLPAVGRRSGSPFPHGMQHECITVSTPHWIWAALEGGAGDPRGPYPGDPSGHLEMPNGPRSSGVAQAGHTVWARAHSDPGVSASRGLRLPEQQHRDRSTKRGICDAIRGSHGKWWRSLGCPTLPAGKYISQAIRTAGG